MVHVSVQSAQVGMDHEAASQVLAAWLCLRTAVPTTGKQRTFNEKYSFVQL